MATFDSLCFGCFRHHALPIFSGKSVVSSIAAVYFPIEDIFKVISTVSGLPMFHQTMLSSTSKPIPVVQLSHR
ncbi:hypothetical protein F2Q68_00024304 [Brassica cretica]|uniref:Uncharacterized protein n=1 Tax=Brassica cretica TaxID=69181 RepID=A0A8S9IHF0_BRACR|nr:hypothetical protein F2Q68_00024304 [Brassica cretica]